MNNEFLSKHSKKFIIFFLLTLVFCIVILFAYQEDEDNYYLDEVNKNLSRMEESIDDAEYLSEFTRKVWYNSIHHSSDFYTDLYTKNNGIFFDDFNDSLFKLFDSNYFKNSVSDIKNVGFKVDISLDRMYNSPDEYNKVRDSYIELYNIYSVTIDLTINPDGSLNTFTSNSNSNFKKYHNEYKKTSTLVKIFETK